MELLRKQVLQAELDRIEAEAEASSYAIMNKADALAAAHVLCQKVNEGQGTDFRPTVIYYPPRLGCQIIIYTHDLGDVFLRRTTELGLTLGEIVDRQKFLSDDVFSLASINEFPGVDIDIKRVYIDMAQHLEAVAA